MYTYDSPKIPAARYWIEVNKANQGHPTHRFFLILHAALDFLTSDILITTDGTHE